MIKRLLFVLICLCAVPLVGTAHVLDQYLQIAQIAVATDGARLELRLIPGVEVADRVFPLIDTDGDGKISSAEEQTYANRVLQDIRLEIDGHSTPLTLTNVKFPTKPEINEGTGTIHLNFTAETALSAAGQHQIYFRNDYLPELGAYLANTLIPATDTIEITDQKRDQLQHEIQITFHVGKADAPNTSRWIAMSLFVVSLLLLLTQWKHLRRFVTGR